MVMEKKMSNRFGSSFRADTTRTTLDSGKRWLRKLYNTISEALAAVPQKYEGRFVIFVATGIYEESVTVSKRMVNLTIIGEGSQKSIIVGRKSVADGVNIYDAATFVAIGEGLFAKSMGFRNIAGPENGEAVAARVQSDRATFHNCRFEGYKNAVWAQTHRQFYRSCLITGTVDFIFGDAATIFQNCQIMVRKPLDVCNDSCIQNQ
ncbi:hypothetical protein CICLE_v10010665mg [Citrus x clementina]|uniref:Pectinesterase n=1 Tax=Citrus clementina TaxID=85681 RepID=V4WHJ8_CITCL|nr:hypothetical protein CICLE_v10010665mg [Citrus x clementina]